MQEPEVNEMYPYGDKRYVERHFFFRDSLDSLCLVLELI